MVHRKISITGYGVLPISMLMALNALPDGSDKTTFEFIKTGAYDGVMTDEDNTVTIVLLIQNNDQYGDDVIRQILSLYSNWTLAEQTDWDVTVAFTYELTTCIKAFNAADAEERANDLEPNDFDFPDEFTQPDDKMFLMAELS